MGHRSWLVEVKDFNDVRACTDFIGHANEICEYETLARLSAVIKFRGKIYLGWDSDGSSAGEVFAKTVLKGKKRKFGLLGESPFDDPGKFYYFQSASEFLKEIKAKPAEKRWFKAARKSTRA